MYLSSNRVWALDNRFYLIFLLLIMCTRYLLRCYNAVSVSKVYARRCKFWSSGVEVRKPWLRGKISTLSVNNFQELLLGDKHNFKQGGLSTTRLHRLTRKPRKMRNMSRPRRRDPGDRKRPPAGTRAMTWAATRPCNSIGSIICVKYFVCGRGEGWLGSG
jgi:hypothetical protein